MNTRTGLVTALVLALGLVIGAAAVARGILHLRTQPRVVSVKGLAERDVRADLAVWPLRYVTSGDDLAAVQREIDEDGAVLQTFLRDRGFTEDEITIQGLQVIDLRAVPYSSANAATGRYIVAQNVTVRSADVDKVATASRSSGSLLTAGVTLAAEYGPIKPIYIFNGLNDLKVEMVAEATARARESAEQFALDSGSELGGIHRAYQGVFQILPRDQFPGSQESDQIDKTVRVVSTIDYLLEN